MYKDNGKLDVELLAEVGCIAHRIRNLDEKLALDQTKSACFKYPYPAPDPAAALATVATPSITVDCEQTSSKRKNSTQSIQIAQEIGDKLNDISVSTEPTSIVQATSDDDRNTSKSAAAGAAAAGCGGRRYSNKHIEDIILEFYEKHLIYHQNLEKERIAAQGDTQHIRSKIYRLTSAANHTMNDSSTATASNTGNTTTAIAAAAAPELTAIVDDGDSSSAIGVHAESECESRVCGANDDGCQQMPEIQISRSDDDRPASVVRPEIDDNSGSGGGGGGGGGDSGFEGTGTGTCSHYCGGWQSAICANQLSDEDLRKLVVELKRKVEFTERMNWLCEYAFRLLFFLFCPSIKQNADALATIFRVDSRELIRPKWIFQVYQNDRWVRRIERPVCPSTPRWRNVLWKYVIGLCPRR